jgi:hypothetical protein
LLAKTFPLYANFASVFVALPGTYFGQFGAGEAVGFLMKFAKAVWIVLESVASSAVAVVRL